MKDGSFTEIAEKQSSDGKGKIFDIKVMGCSWTKKKQKNNILSSRQLSLYIPGNKQPEKKKCPKLTHKVCIGDPQHTSTLYCTVKH